MKNKISNKLQEMLELTGKLTTSMVLDEASSPDSPLHGEFNWDNANAATQHRLWQARKLIKRYNVVVEKTGDTLVHVPSITLDQREGEYKPVKMVVQSISMFERSMGEALAKLTAAKKAVELLDSAAGENKTDAAAYLSLAMKGLQTAESALHKIH